MPIVGITLIHYTSPSPPFGKAAYLGAMVTVFAHPGRRVGQLVEALVLALAGLTIGVSWSVLGLWLSSLMIESNPSGAYTIRAIFFAIALMYHGYLRSSTPRMYLLVLLLIIVCLTVLTTTSSYVSSILVEQIVYPILLASAVIFVVNIAVLPEFSSAYLGRTAIDSLEASAKALQDAGLYFVGQLKLPDLGDDENSVVDDLTAKSYANKDAAKPARSTSRLRDITNKKGSLRSKLSATRNAQNETQFEIAYSYLPPRLLSPIAKKGMKRLVTHVIAVIGTCESLFALLGEDVVSKDRGTVATSVPVLITTETGMESRKVDLKRLKPRREIEFGDIRLMRYLLAKIKDPYLSFQVVIMSAIAALVSCIAYSYVSSVNRFEGMMTDDVDRKYLEILRS